MPFQKITLRPGTNIQYTPTLNEGGWSASNLIRYKDGLPEVKGGWKAAGISVTGAVRKLFWWAFLTGRRLMGAGTDQKLYVAELAVSGLSFASLNDITPAGFSPTGVILWTLDAWGQNLIANARGGLIYQWVAASGFGVPAVVLAGAPTAVSSIAVASPLQMLLAFGSNPPLGGAHDPMLIAWSDEGNNTDWTPTATNQAGSFRLTTGSTILCALVYQQQVLVWTDSALYGMQYIGLPFVWSFTQLGNNCGPISPNAAILFGSAARWMGTTEFWQYNGAVSVVDCSLRDAVFPQLVSEAFSVTFAGSTVEFSEATWFYPTIASPEVPANYVTQNIQEPPFPWSGGGLTRTAWIDAGVFSLPVAGDQNGAIWFHEDGYADGTTAMLWSITSAYIDLASGEQFPFVDLIIPDQILTSGPSPTSSVNYTFFSRNYPGDTPVQYGPFLVTATTEFIPVRIRAREISTQISNATGNVGGFWRHGAPRFRVAADGRGVL